MLPPEPQGIMGDMYSWRIMCVCACVKGNLSWTLRATLHSWLFLDSVGSVRVRTGQRRVEADSRSAVLI